MRGNSALAAGAYFVWLRIIPLHINHPSGNRYPRSYVGVPVLDPVDVAIIGFFRELVVFLLDVPIPRAVLDIVVRETVEGLYFVSSYWKFNFLRSGLDA